MILKSGATGQTQSEVAYVYDGWSVVGVYDITTATPTFQKVYLWGEDLSGNLQGAGGVGGLLAEKRGGQTYLPVYDGNGNIMSYLNASTKASVAEYVYDAFGRTISSSGAEADNFTYRFSTKPLDGSGLYYYGYRYYDPQHGRWISRDPLEENGGVNLYGFVGNNSLKYYDILGLYLVPSILPGQTGREPYNMYKVAPYGIDQGKIPPLLEIEAAIKELPSKYRILLYSEERKILDGLNLVALHGTAGIHNAEDAVSILKSKIKNYDPTGVDGECIVELIVMSHNASAGQVMMEVQ